MRTRSSRLAAAMLGVGALLASTAGLARTPGAGAATARRTDPVLGTPILSVRRLPEWIEHSVADRRLAARLPAVLAPLGKARRTSCLVVEQGAHVIYASNPTQEELPASNLKLLTATAVLDKLGSGTRLTTRVTETGHRSGGTVHGDLYLVGGGDPLLWTPAYEKMQDPAEPLYTSLAQLARQVRAFGITRVDGGVVGDESLFDRRRVVPSWKSSYASDGDVGPLSALDVDNGFKLNPPYSSVPSPPVLAAGVFAGLLRGDGVKVIGRSAAGISPSTAKDVTSIRSAPLGDVVGAILRVSDDTGAELLAKLLGKRFGGTGSTAAGVSVMRADLAAHGLPVDQLQALDGSGLSTSDRVSCSLMVDDLDYVGDTGPIFAGLPVAGRTGTLADRLVGTVAAGRLHAKTGTLDGVSALSGFVVAPVANRTASPGGGTAMAGEALTFSFIANGMADDEIGFEVGDAIGVALAHYPEGPPIADAEPIVPLRTPSR